MSSGPLMPSCLKCRWRQRNFRARSDSFCRLHETIIFDTLGTFCPELDSDDNPALRETVQSLQLPAAGIYVWLLFFRTVPEGSDAPPYYHEPAYLTDVKTYAGWKGHEAMDAQQRLHQQLKDERARNVA